MTIIYRPQLVSRGATLFGLEQAHRQSGLSCKNYGLESVLNPGPGIAGDPSTVPCWIIRMVQFDLLTKWSCWGC